MNSGIDQREAARLLPLIHAISQGKPIQYQDATGSWHDHDYTTMGPDPLAKEWKWRVKPPVPAKRTEATLVIKEWLADGQTRTITLELTDASCAIDANPRYRGHDPNHWALFDQGDKIGVSLSGVKARYDESTGIQVEAKDLKESMSKALDEALGLAGDITKEAKDKLRSFLRGL